MDLLPLEKRAMAVKLVVLQISQQKIKFKFRDTSIQSNAQRIIRDVATALVALPEVSVRVEGHSNYIAKVANKQTPQDKERMVQLSQERAEAVKKALKAEGVQNEISCVGLGCQKQEAVGCVKIVVVPVTGTSKPVEVGSPVKHVSAQDWLPDDIKKSEPATATRRHVYDSPGGGTIIYNSEASRIQTADVVHAETTTPPTPAVPQPHPTNIANMAQFDGNKQVVLDEQDNLQQDGRVSPRLDSAEPGSPEALCPSYAQHVRPSAFVDASAFQNSDGAQGPDVDSIEKRMFLPTSARSAPTQEGAQDIVDPDSIGKPVFVPFHGPQTGQPDLDSSSRNPLGILCCADRPRAKTCLGDSRNCACV